MTVEISFFARTATGGLPVAADPGLDGTIAEAMSVAITASPVLSAATPDTDARIGAGVPGRRGRDQGACVRGADRLAANRWAGLWLG